MLRNYNGDVNRFVIRGLKEVSKATAEHNEYFQSALDTNREVSVYTDMYGELGDYRTITLKGKEEIEEYLRKSLQQKLEKYLQKKQPKEDFLLTAVISFLKENDGRYPTKEEMRQLEIAAENERIASAPLETEAEPAANWMILKEILELAEEIMEAKSETKPEEIYKFIEPYPDVLKLSNDRCCISIERRYFRYGNNRDYSVNIQIIDGYQIYVYYCNDTDPDFYVKEWHNKIISPEEVGDLNKYVIIAHQFLVEVAQQEGFEFVSEVDYEKFNV